MTDGKMMVQWGDLDLARKGGRLSSSTWLDEDCNLYVKMRGSMATTSTRSRQTYKRRSGSHQVLQGSHGLEQAITAVQTAMAATTEGDLDWVSESWSQVVDTLVQEAEELLDEEGLLDYVHPADVVALEEGGQEAPPPLQGGPQDQVDTLLRNVKAVMNFVPVGGAQVRQLLAAILVWKQQHGEGSIAVDTQTTEAGEEGQPQVPDEAPTGGWIPPLDADQWPGSIPSSDVQRDSPEGDPFGPTDEDLMQALEEYERRVQEEAMHNAVEQDGGQHERADLSDGERSDEETRGATRAVEATVWGRLLGNVRGVSLFVLPGFSAVAASVCSACIQWSSMFYDAISRLRC